MPVESVLADFFAELNPNISMIIYGLEPVTLDDVINKAKKMELKQKNTSVVL
jgi:hypothetical protein